MMMIVPGILLLSTPPSGLFELCPALRSAKYFEIQTKASSWVKFGGIVTPSGSSGRSGKLSGGVIGSGGAVGSGGGGGGLTDCSYNTIHIYIQCTQLINQLHNHST